MELELVFKLDKVPKSSGGVKYQSNKYDDFSVYVPQAVLVEAGAKPGQLPKEILVIVGVPNGEA